MTNRNRSAFVKAHKEAVVKIEAKWKVAVDKQRKTFLTRYRKARNEMDAKYNRAIDKVSVLPKGF